VSRSAISFRRPGVSDAGANGCCRANSGQVIGSISAAALSFIVHDPRGIMLRSNAISLSANERKYRIISVSVGYLVSAGWVRTSDVRVEMAGESNASAAPTPNAYGTASTCRAVVASSQDTD